MTDWTAPPSDAEVEVSLFGPGRGECVLIHLGAGEWCVIDSCVVDGAPAALTYLERLKVEPASVRLVIVSHWHDDHVGGLADLVAAFPDATFVCSVALKTDEFTRLVARGSHKPMLEGPSGVDEFSRVLGMLPDGGPRWALADTRIYQREGHQPCEVWALSPSSASVTESLDHISSLVDQDSDLRRAVPRPIRNPAAVVVWISVGSVRMLFGGDLERSTNVDKGWLAIVNSTGRPSGPASFYKVSHHGSMTGHEDRIWTDLLEPSPSAALTPFTPSKLPRPTDVARMVGLSDEVWITRPPGSPQRIKRGQTVDKTVKDAVEWIQVADPATGSLHFRRPSCGSRGWMVDARGPAVRLSHSG